MGQVKASQAHPTLQKTRLGWILAGRLGNPTESVKGIQSFHATVTNAQLQKQLDKFWRQEDAVGQPANYTIDEARCEKHFLENVSRAPGGRYIVKLPIKEQIISKLGDSEGIALKWLQALERRFKREPTLKAHYEQFIKEFSRLHEADGLATRRKIDMLSTASLCIEDIRAIIQATSGF